MLLQSTDALLLQLLLQPVAAAGLRQAETGAVGGGSAAAIAGGRASRALGYPHHELIPAVALAATLGPAKNEAATPVLPNPSPANREQMC